jgi:uncharacterized repeat protein (TIGR03803 family)
MKSVSMVLFAGVVGCASFQPLSAADAVTYKEKVLWSFGNGTDGQYPAAGLLDANGTFYGTTAGGGVYGDGTVFALDPDTDAETVLYFFCIKGEFCLDGSFPGSNLISVKGNLYGTTEAGGNCQGGSGGGTVFSLDPATGKEKVHYSFCGTSGGFLPIAGLLDVEGTFYGTTDVGGAHDFGTAFAFNRKTRTETVLYSFCSLQKAPEQCLDGQNPAPALINVNGTLYGTTVAGGADYTGCDNAGCGTVYSLDPNTGAETILHSFTGSPDGRSPEAGLIEVNGILYGTTFWGGGTGCTIGNGCGTVFSLDLSTGTETVLYTFCSQTNCADGAEPAASLIAVNGTLYGTTQTGGAGKDGTVFSIDPTTGAETVLYSFCSQLNCADGANPGASLIAMNGKLYGTTAAGGAYRYGTVFELKQKR